jgi:hypothetical protein
MGTSDRDRALDDALAGRASAGHPDLDPVAAFSAELRERAARVPVRPSPAVLSLLRGEKDLATYVGLDTEQARRRPALVWAAAAAVAVAFGGVAVAQPWDGGGNTPTAASVTAPVETTVTATTRTASAPSSTAQTSTAQTSTAQTSTAQTSTARPTTAEPMVRTTVVSPSSTVAARRPPVTVETRSTLETRPPSTTVKTRPPEPPKTTAPPPPPAGLEEARARWRACATKGQQEGLTQEQIAARCGNEPNLEGYRSARASWDTCMRENSRSTAFCGPEPDPAAYGFVPPVWPPQP